MSGLCCLLEAGELGGCESPLTGLELGSQGSQFGTVKLPLKRCWVLIRKLFVQGQAEAERLQIGKVIGCQDLALDDGAVDCDLMEPTGVDWCLDQTDTRIDLTQPLLRGVTAMRRAIVHDPKQPFTRPLGFLRQPLLDQAAKGFHTGCQFTPAHDIPPANVPGSQILPGSTTLGCVLELGRSARCGRQRGMATAAGLDAGLLLGAEDVVLGPQGYALPQARLEVQHRAGLVGDVGSTGKNPVLVPPGFDGSRSKNPPHRAATDRCAQHRTDPSRDVGQGLAAQRVLGFGDQFPGDRLDQGMIQRGKQPPCGPGPACHPAQSPLWPNGIANGAPNADGAAPAVPPRCWTPAVVETRAGPRRPVAATGTAQSFARPSFQPAPRMSTGTQAGSSGRDHAWEASSGKTDRHGHQHTAHLSLKSSPKTRTLILKRSTAISGDLLRAVISTCYIFGFRKDNPNVFNSLIQNWLHF